MFARLWHDSLIRGDDQNDDIKTAHSCQHILDKSLMTRDVDESGSSSTRQIKISKPNLDGDSTLLFFFQSIGFNMGQGSNQGRLSMIHMTSCPDDNMFHVTPTLLAKLPRAHLLRG
ncbi:hypothetical protein SDC9_128212 [bioreactor metagenome]|uniref:Uncharacterized protein n=1 Tax=bioreactor metagenome TaxID=1076179 RepID=A0A645CVH5_9ZZZZ